MIACTRLEVSLNMATHPKTVFLSYRRRSSAHLARYLHDRLVAVGVDVFFDVEDINGGRFARIIESEIVAREYFIVVLTPGTLDSEWVRREIGVALREEKQIIPLMAEGFDFSSPLPAEIASLSEYSGIPFDHQYADAAFERLTQALGLELGARYPSAADRLRAWLSSPLWQGIGVLVALVALGLTYWVATRENSASLTPTPPATVFGATFVPTPTLTRDPDPTLTPTPALEHIAILDYRLANVQLTDIAAANGHVWLATRTGLMHYDPADDWVYLLDRIPEDLEVLAVDASGTIVWFGSAVDARVGRLLLDAEQGSDLEWFDLPVSSDSPVAALVASPDGVPIVGLQNGLVLRLVWPNEWQALLPLRTDSSSLTLKALALNPTNPDLFWIIRVSGASCRAPTPTTNWPSPLWGGQVGSNRSLNGKSRLSSRFLRPDCKLSRRNSRLPFPEEAGCSGHRMLLYRQLLNSYMALWK
ncbi:MAG: toll/interleukin-1 receptor domain-containing protein [Chloroflexi bacterium]|nr:MAG: toll/interleukin-1 receptor domain-containing protein [Chloroflexota bacterium]